MEGPNCKDGFRQTAKGRVAVTFRAENTDSMLQPWPLDSVQLDLVSKLITRKSRRRPKAEQTTSGRRSVLTAH